MGSCCAPPWSSSDASSCPDYPQCTVRLARFKGIDKSEFLDQRQLHGHAFQILDEAMHFILRNIPDRRPLRAGEAGTARRHRSTRRWPCGKPWSMRSATATTRSPGERSSSPSSMTGWRSPARALASGNHRGRPQAGPCLPPPQPADRRGLLPSRADRAMGSRHPENRRPGAWPLASRSPSSRSKPVPSWSGSDPVRLPSAAASQS